MGANAIIWAGSSNRAISLGGRAARVVAVYVPSLARGRIPVSEVTWTPDGACARPQSPLRTLCSSETGDLCLSIFSIHYAVTVRPDGITEMTQTLDGQWFGSEWESFERPRGSLGISADFSNSPETSLRLELVPVRRGTAVRAVQTFRVPAALGTLESIPTLDDVFQIAWVDYDEDFNETYTVCSPFGPSLAGDPECFEPERLSLTSDGPYLPPSGGIWVSGVVSGALTASQVVVVAEFEGRASADRDVLTIRGSPTITNPQMLVAGSGARSYEYQLPEDPQAFSSLIAFIDLDGDGRLDPSREPVRRPLKSLPECGTAEQPVYWSSQDDFRYVVHCPEDFSQQYLLDEIGMDGFNFRF